MLLDALFPLQCVNCPTYGSLCCQACGELLQEEAQRHPLGAHMPPEGFQQIVTIGSYAHPALQHLIVGLKFHGLKGCAEPLGMLLAEKLADAIPPHTRMVCIPLPLSRRRRFERGYNQAELIASAIRTHWPRTHATDVPPVHTNLLKRAHRLSQTRHTHAQRFENVADAYRASAPSVLQWAQQQSESPLTESPLTIVLVDDVLTTGASMIHARNALHAAIQHVKAPHALNDLSYIACVAAIG